MVAWMIVGFILLVCVVLCLSFAKIHQAVVEFVGKISDNINEMEKQFHINQD